MAQWAEHRTHEIDGIVLKVQERTDHRNIHGAVEYLISAYTQDGRALCAERHSQATWLGHCNGLLLLPLVAERARAKSSVESEVCGDQGAEGR